MPAKRAQYEERAQAAVISWSAWIRLPDAPDVEPGAKLHDYLYHPANGGARRATEAKIFAGLGVKPGVSDLVLPLARGGYFGLYLELKKDRDKFRTPGEAARSVTDQQRAWGKRMTRANYATAVAYGAQEAMDTLAQYIAMPPTLGMVNARPRPWGDACND